MANTRRDFVSDGSTTVYDVAFDLGFISRKHVFVYLDDDNYKEQLDYTWVSSTQIELSSALPTGTKFSIRRVVPRNALVNSYSDGAIMRERELDNSFLQSLMIGQEQEDGYSGAYLFWVDDVDAQNYRLKNLPLPTSNNEPTLKVETDVLKTRVTQEEAHTVALYGKVNSVTGRVTVVESRSLVNRARIEQLESVVPDSVISNVTYNTVNTVLGDKYRLGNVFDDMDTYDELLGRVYTGVASTEENSVVDKINIQLGTLHG